MKNNTQDVVGYRISQLDRPFDLKPNQATNAYKIRDKFSRIASFAKIAKIIGREHFAIYGTLEARLHSPF